MCESSVLFSEFQSNYPTWISGGGGGDDADVDIVSTEEDAACNSQQSVQSPYTRHSEDDTAAALHNIDTRQTCTRCLTIFLLTIFRDII